MVLGVFDGIVGGSGGDEVSRDDLGALVNKLVERVLTVGTRSTPDDRLRACSMFVRYRKMTRTK
jgi:hypothetical protein